MSASPKPHVVIDFDDVRKNGSVRRAILAWAERDNITSSGVIGQEFDVSGPGSGWRISFGVNEFAKRAIQEGALHYIDCDDGRLVSREAWNDIPEKCGWRDMNGEPFEVSDWSTESVVRIECPTLEDAVAHPAIFCQIVESVVEFHYPMSDVEAFRALIGQIRAAAEAIEDIDLKLLKKG